MPKQPADLLIYSITQSERLSFVCDFVFTQRLGISYACTTNADDFSSFSGLKIQYTRDHNREWGGHWMKADGLLYETDVVQKWRTWFLEIIKGIDENFQPNDWTKDQFSMIFFCISRYEAYLPFKPDKHGRMTKGESLMRFFDDTRTPIVDLIIENIGKNLIPDEPLVLTSFRGSPGMISTIDVDYPWLLLHRKWLFSLLFLMRRGKQRPFKRYWRRIMRGEIQDPFDQFDFLKVIHQKLNIRPVFFWLNAKRITKYDRTAVYKSQQLSDLISRVDKWADIGVHPSYFTIDKPDIYAEEIAGIQEVIGRGVTMQRNHFLRIQWPGSFRMAARNGILKEFSTAFADAPGFPLGTVAPVPFFDLIENRTYDLLIYHTSLMDVTLKQYMELSHDEAVELSGQIIQTIKRYKGTFVLLWHNSSLSDMDDWSGWKRVYKEILELGVHELMPNSLP